MEISFSGWLAFCQSPVNQLFLAKHRRPAPVTSPVYSRATRLPPRPASGLRVPGSSAAPARGGKRGRAAAVCSPEWAGGGEAGPRSRTRWSVRAWAQAVCGIYGRSWAFFPHSGRLVLFWPPGSFMLPRSRGGYGPACQGGSPVSEQRGPAKLVCFVSGRVSLFRQRQ